MKSFRQVEDVGHYDETFASVVKSALWGALLGLGSKRRLGDRVAGCTMLTAFLNLCSNIRYFSSSQRVFAQSVNGIPAYEFVCELLRALSGLKQSSWEWYATLTHFLASIGHTYEGIYMRTDGPYTQRKKNTEEIYTLYILCRCSGNLFDDLSSWWAGPVCSKKTSE